MFIKSCRQVWSRSPAGRVHIDPTYQTVTDGDGAGTPRSHNRRTGLVRKLSARWHAAPAGWRAALGRVTGGVRQGALGAGQHAVVRGGDGAVAMLRSLDELWLDGGRVDALIVEELFHLLCYLHRIKMLKTKSFVLVF